MTRKTIVS